MKQNATTLLQYSDVCPFRWRMHLYFCFYCDERYSDPALLREHNRVAHAIESTASIQTAVSRLTSYEPLKVDVTNLNCKLCSETIFDLDDMKTHIVMAHDKKFYLECVAGILPFKLTKDVLKCVVCDTQYDEYMQLINHMNNHFQNFICDQCGAGFVSKHSLKYHTITHQKGNYPCDQCDKTFSAPGKRSQHIAMVHRQVKRYRCQHCGEYFRYFFKKKQHLATVHGEQGKEFKCQFCPRAFPLSGTLGYHIKTVHLKIKRFKCDLCEFQSYGKADLADHVITKHIAERKYECSFCSKAFARKYTLTEHERIHRDDRRFSCDFCDKSFVQKCSLKSHLKMHEGDVLKLDSDEV